ncbi:MAG: SIS domain-containing protein, partial [bacterium]
IYGSGGHNFMIGAEFFSRAGSLCNYNIFMPGGTQCYDSHPATENLPGLAKLVFDYHRVKTDDLMILVNGNGINSTTIESALECKARNIKSIGISSRSFAENVEPDCPNRHPSGQNLHDLVDLHIDCYNPVGDMIITLEKINRKTGASSTFPLALIAQLLNMRAIEMLVDEGITPDFFKSGNTNEGIPHGKKLKDKWFNRIKHL